MRILVTNNIGPDRISVSNNDSFAGSHMTKQMIGIIIPALPLRI